VTDDQSQLQLKTAETAVNFDGTYSSEDKSGDAADSEMPFRLTQTFLNILFLSPRRILKYFASHHLIL